MTQLLCYAINVTLDGCVHHEAGLPPDPESMAFWTDELRRSDTLLYLARHLRAAALSVSASVV